MCYQYYAKELVTKQSTEAKEPVKLEGSRDPTIAEPAAVTQRADERAYKGFLERIERILSAQRQKREQVT
jgi:hypothetical protein